MREAIPPLPQYVFMAWGLVKAQGQLYLHIYNVANEGRFIFSVTTVSFSTANVKLSLHFDFPL